MSSAAFIERWRKRAQELGDPFDRFFSAWLAIVIAARRQLTEEQLSRLDTDRKAVIQYFETNAMAIAEVLTKEPGSVVWLAQRKGTETGMPILDVQPHSRPYLRPLFDDLAQVWSGNSSRKPKWIARATAEMVNHIRNNMFHGIKAPDDAADKALLDHVNPLLLRILATCEA